MSMHTVRTTVESLPESLETRLEQALSRAEANGDPLPPYLSISLIERSDSGDFFSKTIDRYRGRTEALATPLTLDLDVQADSLPESLLTIIESHESAYQNRHTDTTIQQNFSDESLSWRVRIRPQPECYAPCLVASFSVWGLPASSLPETEELFANCQPSPASSNHRPDHSPSPSRVESQPPSPK
jgi:hypothetical protein